MKRLLLFIAFIATFSIVNGITTPYIKTSLYKTNYWTTWADHSYVSVYYSYYGNNSKNWRSIEARREGESSSCFYFRITMDNFRYPDKKTRRKHLKDDEWYEYNGTIEYWIDDEHMDFISCCEGFRGIPYNAIPCNKYDGTPSIIKKSNAKIKIAPYKKSPKTFNVWFEGIGFAFTYYFEEY